MAGIKGLVRRWLEVPPASSQPPQVPGTRVGKQTKSGLEQYSRVAVGPLPGRPAPAQWTLDRQAFVRQFRSSVYIAVGAIARKVAMQEARCYVHREDKSGDKLEPLSANHPLVRLFEEVNPIHTQYDLWYHTIGWRLLTGDSFWWIARNGLGLPAELWPVPSTWIWAVPSETQFIESYLVRTFFAQDTELPANDIVHLREPNLDWSGTGRFYGYPPLSATATQVDLENTILDRLFHQFKNFSPPGLHYETDTELSKEQVDTIWQQIVQQHSLAEQTGLPIVTHSGLKASEFSPGLREMDYTASLDYLLEFVLATYGVPKAVIGLVKDTNRANMQGAMTSFCENTINPLLMSLGQSLTQGLAREFDDRIVIRFEPCVVEDAQRIREDVVAAGKLGAIDPNEVRERLLKLGPFKQGGSTPLVNQSQVSAPYTNVEPEPEEPPAPAAETVDENSEDDELFAIHNGKLVLRSQNRLQDFFANEPTGNQSGDMVSPSRNGSPSTNGEK